MIEYHGIFHITSADQPMDWRSSDILQTLKPSWLFLCVSRGPVNFLWVIWSGGTSCFVHLLKQSPFSFTAGKRKKAAVILSFGIDLQLLMSRRNTSPYFSQWLVPGNCAGWSGSALVWDSAARISTAYTSLVNLQFVNYTKVYQVPTKSQQW